jgi:predicted kinase
MSGAGVSFSTTANAGLECVIFVGLQASGKTTFYNERFRTTHEHVSKDEFRHARNRRLRQAALIDSALCSGRSVVLDNTNPTPADRKAAIELARLRRARVVAYYFDSTIRASLARNREREGRQRVPDVAIFTTAKRLVPPSTAEGFDEIRTVQLTEGGFVVSAGIEGPVRKPTS